MTSIFQGQLYKSFVKDQNTLRLESYDVNRFQRTVQQQASQGQREKTLREGLELHQAIMADLQTKLNEVTEKLNNLYRRFMENQVAFMKSQYADTSDGNAVAGLPRVDLPNADPTYPNTGGYPAGGSGILPHDDFDKIRNFSYNPFFGSKAIEASDKNIIRTLWEEPGTSTENAYRENGAFWSTLNYLWGWDLDRINATYTTGDLLEGGREDVQINITALQPNKPQYPPLKPGDRFPMNWTGNGGAPGAYPAVNFSGLRPGGVDYNHASDSINSGGGATPNVITATISGGNGAGSPPGGNPIQVSSSAGFVVGDVITVIKNDDPGNPISVTITAIIGNNIWTNSPAGSNNSSGTISKTTIIGGGTAHVNALGADSVNFGWEFDDLPMALEVVSVDTRPDGTTVPTEYKVVYDIPPTHPFYEDLKILNGTEPQIMDAPTKINRDVILNDGLEYSGYFYFPGSQSAATYTITDGNHNTGGQPWEDNTVENEYPPPKLFSSGFIPGVTYNTTTGADFGTTTNPVHLSPADLNLFGPPMAIEYTTNGTTWTSAAVDDIQYNSNTLSAGTGNGSGPADAITVSGSLAAFDTNDIVTFNGGPDKYRVTAVFNNVPLGTFGLRIAPMTGPEPIPPLGGLNAGDTIQLLDTLGTGPKYAQEGVVLNIPSGGTDILQIRTPGQAGSSEPVMTFVLKACTDIVGAQDLDGDGTPDADLSAAFVSMAYRFTVHQNYKEFASPPPLDDNSLGSIPTYDWNNNDWTSDGTEYDSGATVGQGSFFEDLPAVNWSYITNSPMGAGLVLLDEEGNPSQQAVDSAYYTGRENVRADLVPGATNSEVILRVFYEGDLNAFKMEINDVQIVRYDGDINSWEQGKYNAGNVEPIIMDGDPTVTQANSPDEVINKYIPGVYQFTQFNDQYNNSYTANDHNDIVRSPWEFAELQFGDNSGLSGEMWLDINGRRINFAPDPLEATIPGWGTVGAASGDTPGTYEVAVSGTNYSLTNATGAVQVAHDFNSIVAPGDECVATDPNGNAENFVRTDSDPLTSGPRNDLIMDETLDNEGPFASTTAPADPLRSAGTNPVTDRPDFYSANTGTLSNVVLTPTDFESGVGENDQTTTYDRIGASVKSASNAMNYHLTIPTTDVNVLRKENNLLVNLGSIEQRDWALNLERLDMYVRTVPEYKTVPRYRVDAGGNVFDQFGKGYYDLNDPDDLASYSTVYPTYTHPVTGATIKNGQVSNFDHVYNNNPAAPNPTGTYESWVNGVDRLSMSGDDYNLFDYVPDLNLDPSSKEGGTYGEVYVGSFPSNFYYYRELMDQSAGELGVSPTGDHTPVGGIVPLNLNNDNRPAINFDGRNENLAGAYNTEHTYVYNAEMPSFTNVTLGIAEQNAKLSNTQKSTSFAVWQDFPGLNSPLSYAQSFVAAQTNNVTSPTAALGDSATDFALMGQPTSSIVLEMGTIVNDAGYMVLNEMSGANEVQGHAIPLPLVQQPGAPYPNPDPADLTPTSYTFDSYGAGTVTRTGSKFMSFKSILDGADGDMNNPLNLPDLGGMALLRAAGGEFVNDVNLTVPPPVPLRPADPAGTNPMTWPDGLLLHVDDATGFTMEYPKNIITFGDDPARYRILYRQIPYDPDTTDISNVHTLFVVPDTGGSLAGGTIAGSTSVANLVQADLQIREVTGAFTVTVVDDANQPSVSGTRVRVDYDHQGTQREGKLVSVGLSSAADRVGRLPGDDPRTQGTTETLSIGPEIFDTPKGYVQPDAQVDLHLVSQDNDGNKKARKLKTVKVEVKSGEQIIPTDLQQTYTTFGAANTFDLRGGSFGNWPIAIYDGSYQINPDVTSDLNYMVGYYQGITAATLNTATVVDASDFKVGHKVTVNGEQRTITNIVGNVLTLDKNLSRVPKYGDRVDLGDGTGNHDLKLFLNRSFAMSMGAGLKITLEYDEYEYTGYPPTVDTSVAGTPVTEVIGYGDNTPKSVLEIDPTNTGNGAGGNGVKIKNTAALADYTVGDLISLNGQTFKLRAKTANTIELGDFTNNTATFLSIIPTKGTASHTDYENFLQTGNGRGGGSSDNEFTIELKRIVDNPEYAELFRHDLFQNVFITAAINDPFNDLIASKITLTWDRIRKQAEIRQASFMAYFKSGQ